MKCKLSYTCFIDILQIRKLEHINYIHSYICLVSNLSYLIITHILSDSGKYSSKTHGIPNTALLIPNTTIIETSKI